MEEVIVSFAESIVVKYPLLALLFFFISQSLQILFPPYPGDMVLILEGYLSYLGNLSIVLVILNAILATYFSSVLLYRIGRKNGYKILHSKYISKIFKINNLDDFEILFNKYSHYAIIISKFIPGFFSLTVLSAGIFKVDKNKTYISILTITSIHHFTLILLGKKLGENWRIILNAISTYSRYVIVFIVIGLGIYLIIAFIKKRIILK